MLGFVPFIGQIKVVPIWILSHQKLLNIKILSFQGISVFMALKLRKQEVWDSKGALSAPNIWKKSFLSFKCPVCLGWSTHKLSRPKGALKWLKQTMNKWGTYPIVYGNPHNRGFWRKIRKKSISPSKIFKFSKIPKIGDFSFHSEHVLVYARWRASIFIVQSSSRVHSKAFFE